MENASKALIMAGGILVGILILALMATLLISSNNLSGEYERNKQSEAIQQFNVNFSKYVGQNLTIHQVVTIINFAESNKIKNVTISGTSYNDIKSDVENYTNETSSIQKYSLNINSYDENGYVDVISFTRK